MVGWTATWEALRRNLASAGAVIATWWRWLLVGLALIGATLLALWTRRRVPAVTPAPVDPTSHRVEVEADAQKQVEHLTREAAEKAAVVTQQADRDRVTQVEQIQVETTQAQGDAEKVNIYLKNVGEEMRKP